MNPNEPKDYLDRLAYYSETELKIELRGIEKYEDIEVDNGTEIWDDEEMYG